MVAIFKAATSRSRTFFDLNTSTGTYTGWKATAIGQNFKTPLDLLEKKWEENMSELATKKLAIKALLEICEANTQNMEIMIVRPGGGEFMTGAYIQHRLYFCHSCRSL